MMFIIAVLMLAFLIFVHELGHFIIARICGVKVEVFSIGFGKKLCFFKLFGTQFALSLIPLGGYVKLKGMDKEEKEANEENQANEEKEANEENQANEEKEANEENQANEEKEANDSYAQKSPFQKLWILFGGAFFNFLFAILVYFFLALSGEKVLLPIIGDLEKNALEAGLLKGDKILSINHQKIASFREIRSVVARSQGELILEIERNHQILEKRLTPKIVAVISESNDPNEIIQYKVIGIKPDMQKMGVVSYSLIQAFKQALSRFKEGVVLIVDSLRRLIMGSASVKELSGVIGIVGALSHANSLSMLLLFGAFLSINLGILNLLPIPALDGAQMLGVVFKNIFHITLPTPIQNALWLAGVGFLVFIMFLGLFNDITRLL
ncbi:RIP metalloprotease RseP [Helicobacter pylori NQ4099]|uniref:Zinc metalloprotease n=1 Tax=Helicobacter pylori NQ4099 TaxID=992026 RepID=I9QAU2_HELPX|nr:RIP metalloprotease RseP [Helicobacter pylori]EJB30284.1 RIP metalloprotease RseP [Helicobacter pylori NQ4099]